MSLIAGIKDQTLTEKAIAEDCSLKQVIQSEVNRETFKANVEAMQARPHTNIHRVEESLYQGGDMDARINYLYSRLEDVMKIRRVGSTVAGPPTWTTKETSAHMNME